jgi:hypothetical protein
MTTQWFAALVNRAVLLTHPMAVDSSRLAG